jgi:hypothetical protein
MAKGSSVQNQGVPSFENFPASKSSPSLWELTGLLGNLADMLLIPPAQEKRKLLEMELL